MTGRTWKLEDAKARFSEVVRRAQSEGPQRVTIRGREAAVVMDGKAFEAMRPGGPKPNLVAFLESLELDGLDLRRDPDRGRDEPL
jgi:prevent-host-death family protein